MRTSDYIEYVPEVRHEKIVYMLQDNIKRFIDFLELATSGVKNSGSLTTFDINEIGILNAQARVSKRILVNIMTNENITKGSTPMDENTFAQHVDKLNMLRISRTIDDMAKDRGTEPSEIELAHKVIGMFREII